MGPFEHHPCSEELLAASGNDAKKQAATLEALEANLSSQNDAASKQAAGQIEGAVTSVADQPKADAAKIRAAALVVGSAVARFAQAVAGYNLVVDSLNETYWKTEKSDRPKVLRDLKKTEQLNANLVDDEADAVAALLIAGPTTAVVLELYLGGWMSQGDAATALGLSSVEPLKNAQEVVDAVDTSVSLPDALPALAAYLAKHDPMSLTRSDVAVMTKALENMPKRMHLEDRIRLMRAHSERWGRMITVREAGKAGPLFGKLVDKLPESAAIRLLSRIGGKVLPGIGIASGAYGLYNTGQNWNKLTVPDRVNGIAGGILGGVAGAAALAALAPSAPAGLGMVAIGAGVLSLASLGFEYREEIADAASWVADHADDIGDALVPG